MSEYLSEKTVWLEPTKEIHALDDKEIMFVQGSSQWEMHLRVDSAPPNSPEHGNVAVIAWQVVIPDLEDGWQGEDVNLTPSKAPKYLETYHWQRCLTQRGLDSIRPRSSQWPEHIKLELVLPAEAESSDR